jgi:hypothetical protein
LPGSATGQQMYNTLVNAGVKPAELDYSGAKDWLNSQGKVTRQQVQDYLKTNGIQLGEVTKEQDKLYSDYSTSVSNSTKYHGYTEPGPKANYAEKLITLPDKNLPETTDPYEARRRRIEEGAAQFQSDHWDEPNVLAHARYDDRTLADGKKALFVEEAQSDWHQQGKKEGYVGEGLSPEETAEMTQLSDLPRLTEEQIDRLNELTWKGSGGPNAVPAAPFKNDWHELVMKRMLREAAERGADKLAWTTGDQQAERYDLSKQISQVSMSGSNLKAFDHDGEVVISRTGVKT